MAVGMEVLQSHSLLGMNFRSSSSSSSPIPISSHHLHSRGAASPVQNTISLISAVSFPAQSLTCTCHSQKSSLPVSFSRKNCSSLAFSNALGHYPLQSRGWRAAALNLNPLELRQRRSDFFKVLKTSASSVLSWLRRRRRILEIRPLKLVMTSPALMNVFRIRLQSSSSTAGKFDESGNGRLRVRCHSSLSVSSQAEGNENTFVLPEERQEQYQVQQQEKAGPVEGFLATGYGWRVREVAKGELRELIRVADIQTAAFHERVALFDDLFYKIFHAEVLSSLQYKARHFTADKYSCLLAERDPTQPGYIDEFQEEENELAIVGAVDCTALMEGDIVSHLPGAEEYLYISGMAVDSNYRRQRVATLLLEACLARAWQWGFDYLVLHAYEDDLRARTLYSRAGYLVIASDPAWMSKFFGRRRRVVMAKRTHKIPEC